MRRFAMLLAALLFVGLIVGGVAGSMRSAPAPLVARIHQDFATVLAAVERYRAAGKRLPEEGELDFLVPDYLPEVPLDPWERPYRYASNGQEVFLTTFGADGVRNGNDEDEDHNNHDGHSPPAPQPAGGR